MKYLEIRDAINRKLGKDTKLRPVLEFAQGLDFGARYLRHEVLPRPKVAATREVYIEWVNYCNLRCSFCALDHSMQKQRMSADTWRMALETEVQYDDGPISRFPRWWRIYLLQ